LLQKGKAVTTKIKPLHDRILVKRMETEQKTAGGIIIPDSAQEKTYFGTIVSTGSGRINRDGSITPLQVKIGDKVVFGKFTGTDFVFENEEFLILCEDDVLGIIS